MKQFDEKEKRSLARIGFFFTLVAIAIAAVGHFSYQSYAAHLRAQVDEQIISVNRLKANELTEQLGGYLSDAEILHRNNDFAAHVQDYFKAPQDDKLEAQVRVWLQSYQPNGEYENMILLDPKGAAYISASDVIPPVSSEVKAHIAKAVSSKQVEFVDYYKDETDQSARLAVLIPITDSQSGSQVTGLVLMVINPNHYLYPYIQQWPVPSESGESMLVRREGDEILLLNTLRLGSYAPLTFRIDLTDANAAAMKAAIEGNRSATGMDYRGVSVVAIAHAIPDSSWILITKVDTAEAYEPARGYLEQTIIVCIALISIVGVALAMIWRSQRLRYYRQQFELAKALSQSELNLRSFFNTVDHMLFVLDGQGDILLTNDTVSRVLGYSAEEMKGKNVLTLHPPERREEAGRIVTEMLAGTADYCPVPLLAKDGQYIPVETRVTKGQWSGQDVVFGVTKDISEIQASEEKFSKVFQSSPSPMAITDTRTGRYIDVNEIFLKTLGFMREDVIDKTAAELNLFVNIEQRAALLERMKVQGFLRNEDVLVRAKSGDLHHGIFSAEYIKLQNQELLLTVMNDITERKQVEEKARASELRFSAIFQASPVRISITRFADSLFLDVNETFLKTGGYTREEIIGRTSLELSDWADPQERVRLRKALEEHGKVQNFETQIRRKSGEIMDVLISAEIIELLGERCVLSVGLDITERKQMERELNNSRERLIEAQQLSHLGNWEWDLQKQGLFWSDEVYRIFGVKPGEFTPTVDAFENAIHPEDREDFLRQRAEMLAEKQSSSIDHRIILPDGQIRHVQERTQLTLDQNGNASRAIGTVQDITELKQIEEALRKSETLLSEAQQIGHIGHWEWTAPGRNLNVSDEVLRIFGMPLHEGRIISQEIIGAMMLKEDFENIRKLDHAIFLNHSSDMDYEFRVNLPGGKEHWIHQKAKIEYSEDGNPVRMMGTVQDVTERKLAEEKYRNIFENSMDGIFQTTPEGKPITTNPALARILGYDSPEDFVASISSTAHQVYVDANTRTEHLRLLEENNGSLAGFEYQAKRKDGSIIWVSENVRSIRDANGNLICYEGMIEDISRRKLAETRLSRFWDLPIVGMAFTSTDRRFLEVNQEFADMMGCQIHELVGVAWPDVTHPDDIAENVRLLQETLAGKTDGYSMEKRFIRRDGTILYAYIAAQCIRHADGAVDYFALVIQDITARKQAEDAVRAAEEKYRVITEYIDDIVWQVDTNLKFTYASPAAERVLGYSSDEVGSLHISDLLDESGVAGLRENLQARMEQKIAPGKLSEYRMKRKDGSWLDTEVLSSPVFNGNGRLTGFVGVTRNITERKLAEQALRESEEKYRLLAENISDVIWIVDVETSRYRYISPSAEQLRGFTVEEIMAQDVTASLTPEFAQHLAKVSPARMEEFKSGKMVSYLDEMEQPCKDGTTVWTETTARFFINPENGRLEIYGVSRDVTERKFIEKQLQDAEEKYRTLVEQTPAVVYTDEIGGAWQYLNPQIEKVLGFSADRFIQDQMAFKDLIHPDDLERFQTGVDKCVKHGGRINMEYRMTTRDGRQVWIRDEANAETDPVSGKTILKGVLYDITERKLTEEALQENEARFHSLFEDSPIAIWEEDFSLIKAHIDQLRQSGVTDFRAYWNQHPEDLRTLSELIKILEINQASAKLLGVKNKEQVLKNLKDYFTEESLNAFKEEMIALTEGQTQFKGEIPVKNLLGETVVLDLTLNVQPGCEDNLSRVLVSFLNITDRKMAEDALRASEANYRKLVETSESAISVLDESGNILYANLRANRLWNEANLVGKSLFDIYPREFAEQYLAAVQEIIRTQKGITSEAPDQINGRQVWFRINMQPLQNADGSSDSVMISTLDITEKVESDMLLKESETRFRQLADNIQEVFWMYDRQANQHIYSNAAYESIYGIRAEDINIHSLIDITLPEDRPTLLTALEKQNNGEATEAEYRIRHKDNSIHWIWDRSFPIHDESGKLVRTAGVATDITENKKTENDLRERESFLQSVVNSAPGIIVSYDLEGYLQYANQSLPQQSDAAFHNMKFLDLLHPDHIQPVLDAFQKVVTTWEPQRLELLILTQNDSYHWFDVTYSPQIISGEVKGLTSFAYDINERKQAEAALQKSEAVYRQAIEVSGAVPYLQAYTNIGEGIDYTFIGEGIRQITGYGPEEFNGKLWDSLVEEMVLLDDLAGYSIHEAIQRVRSGENSIWKCEHRIRARNGETRWVFEAAVELRDANGNSHGSIGLYQDITERKVAEEQLRQSEERFRTLYETMLDGVVYQNRNGEIISTNSAAERILGLSFDQMRGLTSTDPRWRSIREDGSPLPGDEHPAMLSLRTGLPVRDTIMGVYDPKYNSTTWININAVPQFLPDETEPFQVYTIFRDITLQKQDEIITRKRLELVDYAIGHSFSELVQKALEQMCELFQSPIGFFLELINNGNEARLLAWSPNTLNEFYKLEGENGMRYPQGNAGLWADAVRDGKPLIHNDYASEPNRKGTPERHPELIREMVVPMQRNNRVLGVVGVGNKNSEYSQTDLETAARFSDFIWDIVERKQTELALRDSEEKYRGLMESLDSVVATADFEGRFLYMNDMAADQLGGEPRDFIGKTMHELFPAPIADAQLKTIQQAFREDKGMLSETMSMVQNQARWYRTMIQPIHDENGEVVYALINSTDIHDLKTAQHDLQELNRTLEERVNQRAAEVQDLYDNAPNGYHSLDADGAFILINKTELKRLGYSRREILGVKKFRDLLTPQSQGIFDEIFPEFKVNGNIADLTLELIRKDGSVFPVLLNASIMRDEHGKFLMSRSTTIDITERVKAENALRESRDELSTANAALEKAAHMKDEFLASMSHELRTPLTGVLGLSEALQLKAYGDLNEKQLKTLKTIEESGRHLLDLINDILDLSKIEAGRLDLQLAPTYMGDICQASLQLIKGMAQQKHQQIRYTPAAEVILGYADARRIKQILVNLLSNAVKFTPNGGEIGLDVENITSEKKLRFSVWDKGIGIKPEDMHKLFKPFTQIDSSLAREYNGTGLGLSLAHRLVELHNGGIEVESVPGEGSRFTVTLPWVPQEAQASSQTSAPRRRQSDFVEIKKSASATILVADDNETVLSLLSDFLETRQYHVVKVRSGAELITKVAEIVPDLMLVDIQMPGMDGLETIRHIRAHANAAIASTPIIAVTALAMPGDRELCMRAGANDYMSKPLRLLELAEIIEKWKRT